MRQILRDAEKDADYLFVVPETLGMADDMKRRVHHCALLCDAGLIVQVAKGVFRLSNAGHDFLETTRDEGLWRRTKDAVAKSGGHATLDLIKTIATAYLKQSIREKTGLEL